MQQKISNILHNITQNNKTGDPLMDQLFGEFYGSHSAPDFLNGWNFNKETILKASSKGDMYHADIDIPYQACQLHCLYCFTDKTRDTRYSAKQNWLSFDEWQDAMYQLQGAGVTSVKIVGQGETTSDSRYFDYLECLHKLKITPVVFTSGYVFGDDRTCTKIHKMSCQEAIDRTLELGASVMVKFDSPNHHIQDAIVRKNGYTIRRNKAIHSFLSRKCIREGVISRFGLETNLGAHNIGDILYIYCLRKLVGIYPDICLSMDCGALASIKIGTTISGLSQQQIADVYAEILYLNMVFNMRDDGFSPYIGVMKCSQVYLPSIYLTGSGEIFFSCCGNTQETLGNIRNISIKDAISRARETKEKYMVEPLHGCPFREKSGVITPELEGLVASSLNTLLQL